MIYQTEISPKVSSLFANTHLDYMIGAMVEGNSPASGWVDNLNDPRTAIVWDGAYCLFLGGDANNTHFNPSLKEFIRASLLPKTPQVLKVYDTHEAWETQKQILFETIPSQTLPRVLYVADTLPINLPENKPPEEFTIRRIDATLLMLRNGEDLRHEISMCWTSLDRFFQEGFGYCAVHRSDEIVCWCTAEYVSDGRCGVGIETIEDYQQQGLATEVAKAFMHHAMAHHWQIHWDSWKTNIPSVRIAEKLGFHKSTDYTISMLTMS